MSKKPQTQAAPAPAPEPTKQPRAYTALALLQVPGKGWVSLKLTVQGERVTKIEATEPDVRMVAQEKFKFNVYEMLVQDAE